MKEFVKQFVPPIFVKMAKSTRSYNPLFSSFDEAKKACTGNAYQNADLIDVVVKKSFIFRDKAKSNPVFDLSILRTLIGVGIANNPNRLNVLDFGGGGGYHFTVADTALGKGNSLRWAVVETPLMVKAGQPLSTDRLRFFDNISDAKTYLDKVDLVFSSSALQYTPAPLEFIKNLVAIGAPYIFITRTPFHHEDSELITIQDSLLSNNGPGPLPEGFTDRTISYPITYASRFKVESLLKERYHLRFIIEEEKGTFHAAGKPMNMYGYFGVLK